MVVIAVTFFFLKDSDYQPSTSPTAVPNPIKSLFVSVHAV